MIKYIKPEINSTNTVDLIEHLGLRCTNYGYVTMKTDRTAMLEQPNKQIVICKNIPKLQSEIVKLG